MPTDEPNIPMKFIDKDTGEVIFQEYNVQSIECISSTESECCIPERYKNLTNSYNCDLSFDTTMDNTDFLKFVMGNDAVDNLEIQDINVLEIRQKRKNKKKRINKKWRKKYGYVMEIVPRKGCKMILEAKDDKF